MRRTLLLLLALVGCSSDSNNNKPIDAPPPPPVDTAPAAPDPAKYCADIIAHCTGANAQYPTATAMDQCLGTAKTFPVGTAADTLGNTLGCRAYHAGVPSMTTPATHCIHAGPGGDQIGAAGTCGDACTSFCNLEVKICGTIAAPLTGITPQYQDAAACMTACAGFAKNPYVLNTTQAAPSGDSLACRLYHATNAAYWTQVGDVAKTSAHCGHTGVVQAVGLPCNGTPAP